MSGVLEQVEKLIALAASPYEEEARSAAFRACALIRSNGFKVVARLPPPVSQEPTPPKAPPFMAMRRGEARRFFSKYAGTCVACGKGYDVGAIIYWVRDEGATHGECGAYWDSYKGSNS